LSREEPSRATSEVTGRESSPVTNLHGMMMSGKKTPLTAIESASGFSSRKTLLASSRASVTSWRDPAFSRNSAGHVGSMVRSRGPQYLALAARAALAG
jgi:hypothetical protein